LKTKNSLFFPSNLAGLLDVFAGGFFVYFSQICGLRGNDYWVFTACKKPQNCRSFILRLVLGSGKFYHGLLRVILKGS
jgi:hypothetical protein